MAFGYATREDRPCFGCNELMDRCVCDHEVCSKCKWTVDEYGYCACRLTETIVTVDRDGPRGLGDAFQARALALRAEPLRVSSVPASVAIARGER